ncbi:MAG TPA: HXXEE domain-containing protein [Thermoanaerobaculia bacterium]|nr:HXXEE domain-containing protein [Thermoanaerobaculia bacterium]
MTLFWLPLAAASAHITEEFVWPGGFGKWYRGYRPEIAPSMTTRFLFWINAALLFGCFAVGVDQKASFGPMFFLAMCAMLAQNGVFHLIATLRARRYSPGVVTGVVAYLPLAAYGYWFLTTRGNVSISDAIVAAAIGLTYPILSLLNHKRRARHIVAA